MTWELARADDDRIELRHDGGRLLAATAGVRGENRSIWTVTVTDRHERERLARFRWEVRDEDHLWSVLDALTFRFDPTGPTKQLVEHS